LAGRFALARTLARRADRRGPAAPVRLFATERYVARSRLHGVTASVVGDGAAAFVDLHAHSTASDGSRSPADVIREAKRVGLHAIALTDHDTVSGIPEAVAAGA